MDTALDREQAILDVYVHIVPAHVRHFQHHRQGLFRFEDIGSRHEGACRSRGFLPGINLPFGLDLHFLIFGHSAPPHVISIVRGLSRAARGMNSERRPSLYSAFMPSGSICIGTERVRSNTPQSRSRRWALASSGNSTFFRPAILIVLFFASIFRSSRSTPGNSMTATRSSPCWKTFMGG